MCVCVSIDLGTNISLTLTLTLTLTLIQIATLRLRLRLRLSIFNITTGGPTVSESESVQQAAFDAKNTEESGSAPKTTGLIAGGKATWGYCAPVQDSGRMGYSADLFRDDDLAEI